MAKQTKKKAVRSQRKEPVKQEFSFSDGFLLQPGEELIPLAEGFSTTENLAEKPFRSESDLYNIFIKNSHLLFGDKKIVIQVKNPHVFGDDLFPPLLMLDLSDPNNVKLFILDMYVGSQNFYVDVFPRVSRLFLFFKKSECKDRLIEYLAKDKALLKKFLASGVSKDTIDVLKEGIHRFEGVYFISEEQIDELENIKEVYSDHWTKVKQLVLKKLAGRKNSYLSFIPSINDITWNKKKRVSGDKAPTTEAEHLENCTTEVKEAYRLMKSSLLKLNPQLTINVQKYYIAYRKQKNVVIFLITKKKISVVVVYPESKTKKIIKHHAIKSLTEKVQRFYGAASCMIKIENSQNLEEVTDLFKLVVSE